MATVNLDTAARLDIVCRKRDLQLVLDFGVTVPSTTWLMQVREDHGGTIKLDGFDFDLSDGDDTNSKLTISASAAEMNFDAGLMFTICKILTPLKSTGKHSKDLRIRDV